MKKSKSSKKNDRDENPSNPVEQIPRARIWLFRLIALIIIPVIFFSVLELSLRLFNFGYPSKALIETKINSTDYVRENSDFAYRFFPKKLAQEFIPLRFKAEKPEGVFRIFILGGSAAQGIPDPAYSFGRILDVMLKIKYPDTKFEILPLAMTAINSHVVLEIAKDCVDYNPDLFVVYLGNNEVVGPYGPGTVLTPILSNSFLLHLIIDLKATKTSQLITQWLEKLDFLNSPYESWKGMEMFLQNKVAFNDPRLETTYKNFIDNLENLNRLCRDNNIKIIYNTVASNLKDSPPFNSVHRSNINSSDLQRWKELYSSGSAFEDAGMYSEAISQYLEAEKIDSEYADLQFKLGRCSWRSGKFREAYKRFVLAREYDCNRFRADNRINEIIRQAAAEIPGTTFLSDAKSEIEKQSPNGVPGNEFLYEHVHMIFEGNYLVAKTILNQIENIYSKDLQNQKTKGTVRISDSTCAAKLAYNNYERHRILELVLNGFIKQPPFTNQLYHSETIKKIETELDSIQNIINAQDPDYTNKTFEEALQKRPADWMLHEKYADYLADDNMRKYQEAADQYQFVINTIPFDPNIYVKRGVVLAKLGRLEESLDHFQQALNIKPTIAKAYYNSGLVYQKLNNLDLAVENYKKAVNYEPTHTKAYNNMAFIFSQRGDTLKALQTVEQGLKASPDDLLLNYNKAMILFQYGKKPEAIEQLQHAIHIAPNEVMLQEKLKEWLNGK